MNRLGIVTAFTLSTYPIHQVWGGIKSYTLDELPALFTAAIEYQSNPNKDPYANFMMQAFTTNVSVGAVLNMVYLKPEESPPAFSPFYSIPTTGDTTKIQTLTQMMSGQIVPPIPRYVKDLYVKAEHKPDIQQMGLARHELQAHCLVLRTDRIDRHHGARAEGANVADFRIPSPRLATHFRQRCPCG